MHNIFDGYSAYGYSTSLGGVFLGLLNGNTVVLILGAIATGLNILLTGIKIFRTLKNKKGHEPED